MIRLLIVNLRQRAREFAKLRISRSEVLSRVMQEVCRENKERAKYK